MIKHVLMWAAILLVGMIGYAAKEVFDIQDRKLFGLQ
jgi:hypothetical protein